MLFGVNPGEGFNLRRDVFIRMANLVVLLNKEVSNVYFRLKVKKFILLNFVILKKL